MIAKPCITCGAVKPLGDFYKHPQMADGYLKRCKVCHCARNKERRQLNPEKAKAQDRRKYLKRREAHLAKSKEYRERNSEAVRKKQREWVRENKEYRRQYHQQYYDEHRDDIMERVAEYVQTDHGHEVKIAANRKWTELNPEKKAAHRAVNNAVRDGRLERQPCEICGVEAQAHHEDYAKQLDVRWLCSTHHGELHRGRRRGAA